MGAFARHYAFVHAVAVMAIVLCAAPARAQSEEGSAPDHVSDRSPSLKILIGTQAILHSADIFTTVYALRLDGRAREANPLLAPFSGRPAALAAVTGAVGVLQIYTIARLHKTHPKPAIAWSLVLIGIEAYAVTNNVRAVGQLKRDGTR